MEPLFQHYRRDRTVYTLDLPGFGLSDRSERTYSPRLMTDALLAVFAHMRDIHGVPAVDVVGLSLSGEFVARAQSERPERVRRVALISPTEFGRSKRRYGPPGDTLSVPWLGTVCSPGRAGHKASTTTWRARACSAIFWRAAGDRSRLMRVCGGTT